MCKKITLKGMVVAFLLMVYQSAFATVILDFSPNSQTTLLSGQASVDIVADNLQNEFIGGFDFNASWDSNILSLANVSFGSVLGSPSFPSATIDNSAGFSNLSNISFLLDLTSVQSGTGSIILATLVFDTLAAGMSGLTLTGNISGGGFLSDEYGLLLAANANSGSVNVVVASVPEPGTLFLLGAGLLMILSMRKLTDV